MNPVLQLKCIARWFTLVLLTAPLLSLHAAAQTNSPIARANSADERFLVIVETSAATAKRAENIQKVVGSIISGGLQGQVAAGSTIGLWTFHENLFTGQLPLQQWTPANRQRVALTLVQFLQQQKFEKAGRLTNAWHAATNIIAQSERITVMLITAGTEAITGTPFDAAIAESFSNNAAAQRKSQMPFLTILRAVNGKFVAFAVNMPPWPLEVPEYPPEYQRVVAPPAPAPAPVAEKPVPQKVVRTSLSPTNTIHLVETSPPLTVPLVEATNVVAAAPAPTPATISNSPAAPLPSAATATPAEPTLEPPQVATTAAVENIPPAAAPVAATPSNLPIVTILIAGIAVLLAVLVVFLALLSWTRRSSGASLITHSMHQDRK